MNLMKITFQILTMTALLLPSVASAQMQDVSFKKAGVMRTGTLKLKDILDTTETDLEFVQKYGNQVVMTEDDDEETLTRSKVYAMLLKAGINLENISVKIDSKIEIERGQELDVNQHKSLMTRIFKDLAKDYNLPKSDIKIERVRILPKLQGEAKNNPFFRTVRAKDLSNLKNAKFQVLVEDLDGRGTEHTLYIKMNVETPVLVAKEMIDAGATLSDDMFIQGRKKLDSLKTPILQRENLSKKTWKMTQEISKDAVLMLGDVRESLLVKEGAMVTLSYKTSSLNISTLGKLRDTGEIGQVVRVENLDSQRVVNGILKSKNLVEVANE